MLITPKLQLHLDWTGPHAPDQLSQLTEGRQKGLYQIYGTHPIYGRHQLLYIGKTSDQDFARRIGQESWGLNADGGQVQVYIGRLIRHKDTLPCQEAEWDRHIDLAERLLIYSHAPACNAQCLQSISPDLQFVQLFNWHHRACLLPEVSGMYYITKPFGRDSDWVNYP